MNEGQQQCSIAHSHYVEQKLVCFPTHSPILCSSLSLSLPYPHIEATLNKKNPQRAIGQPTVPLHKAPPFCRDSLHVQEADCEPGGMRENTFVMRMRRQMKLAKPLAVAAGD